MAVGLRACLHAHGIGALADVGESGLDVALLAELEFKAPAVWRPWPRNIGRRSVSPAVLVTAVAVLAFGGALAQSAAQYRFAFGPYPSGNGQPGPTSAAVCASQPYWPTPSSACQAAATYQAACDRPTATYRNQLASLNGSLCAISWQYQNVGSGSWNSFSTSLALQTLACPAGSIVGPNSQCVPLVVTEITASPPQNGNACYGNPIYPLRGSKIETIDLGIDVGWHRLSLTYNNEKNLPASASIATGIEGSATPDGFGTLWYGSLHRKLRLEQGLLAARVGRGGGRVTSFSGNGAGLFAGAPQTNDHLTPVSGGYQFADLAESVIESYSSSGRLLRIDKANGQNLVFTYSATATAAAPGPGYLVEVMDTFGRVTKFNYGADGMVSAIVDPAGRQTGISYSIGNLKTLTWPDQRPLQG